jgi:hypothetical protein
LDKITQENSWARRYMTVTWRDSSFVPPRNLVTQASGICFTDDGQVVLVSLDGKAWSLPGGHPECNEKIEDAFRREVAEEACAKVISLVYLGAQEVNDPENPGGLKTYYQTRFWARVQLNEFSPEKETVTRKLVKPETINKSLCWKTTQIIEAIMKAALDCEQRYRANKKN